MGRSMAYYTNKPCQHAAGKKNWKPNNIFVFCVIYTYALIKIWIIAASNKKFPKKNTRHISCNKLNACVRYISFLHQMIRLKKYKIKRIFILSLFQKDVFVLKILRYLHSPLPFIFSLLPIARKNDQS